MSFYIKQKEWSRSSSIPIKVFTFESAERLMSQLALPLIAPPLSQNDPFWTFSQVAIIMDYRHQPLFFSGPFPLVLSRDARKLPSTPMRQPATRHAETGLHLQRVNRPPTMLLTT